MLTLSFSKILMTVLVIVVAWRGYRMYLQLQSRLAATSARPHAAVGGTESHRPGRVPALRPVRAQRHDLPQRRAVPVPPHLSRRARLDRAGAPA